MNDDINRCKDCKHFTGGGDWNLCCDLPHPEAGVFGHLCYETTPACTQFEPKNFEPYNYFDETLNI